MTRQTSPDTTPTRKQSYTVPCASAFRDAVLALADRRGVNVGDLARSVALVLPDVAISAYPDPGEPDQNDRETIILKSGKAKGRPWRRKPRLQVRMVPGLTIPFIRRSLAITLAMDEGRMDVNLTGRGVAGIPDPTAEIEAMRADHDRAQTLLRETLDEIERLRAMVDALAFEPLPGGIGSRDDALHVLGFRPGSVPSQGQVRTRFRELAAIHHPDGAHGDHDRMSQLNAAMEYLRRSVA